MKDMTRHRNVRLLRPQSLTTHGDRGIRRRVSLEYLGYLRCTSNTPPTLDRIVDSVKWNQERTVRETQRKLGKGCKWRTMHHVTINQKNTKRKEDKKKVTFHQENCLPKNAFKRTRSKRIPQVPPKEQEATISPSASKRSGSNEFPTCLQKNRMQQNSPMSA